MTRLTVTIDDKCQGHGICYAVAPEIFEPDDEGFATVKDLAVEAGSDLERQARHAAQGCPEQAIQIATG